MFTRVRAPHEGLHPSSLNTVVHRACRRAGLEEVGPHRLRHTAATEMLRAGSSLREVGQVLRHRGSEVTSIYAKADRLALAAVVRLSDELCVALVGLMGVVSRGSGLRSGS